MNRIVFVFGFFILLLGCEDAPDGEATLGGGPIIPAPGLVVGTPRTGGQDAGTEEVLAVDADATPNESQDGDGSPDPDSGTSDPSDSAGVESDTVVSVDTAVDTSIPDPEPDVVEPDGVEPGGVEVDVSDGEGGTDLSDLDLFGELPQDALPVTLFLAENWDGGARTEADLIGQPTVLWFFPFAGTPG